MDIYMSNPNAYGAKTAVDALDNRNSMIKAHVNRWYFLNGPIVQR